MGAWQRYYANLGHYNKEDMYDLEKNLYGSEHHVTVLPANHIRAFYMGSITNTQFHVKCSYMISQEYSLVLLQDHTSISRMT